MTLVGSVAHLELSVNRKAQTFGTAFFRLGAAGNSALKYDGLRILLAELKGAVPGPQKSVKQRLNPP